MMNSPKITRPDRTDHYVILGIYAKILLCDIRYSPNRYQMEGKLSLNLYFPIYQSKMLLTSFYDR